MDVTVAEAAEELGVVPRTIRAHVFSGRLQVTRTVGRTQLIEHAGLIALKRGAGVGRAWAPRTAWAALELLDSGTTHRLVGSDLSRLRARLRGMPVSQFAHLCSGRGRLRRWAQVRGDQDRLRSSIFLSGTTKLVDDEVAVRFGLAAGASRVTMGYAAGVDELAVRHGLVESADGDVFLRELVGAEEPHVGLATAALDLYELGRTRESAAGAAHLKSRLVDDVRRLVGGWQ